MKIAAIVPAFNEEKTIGKVLTVLVHSGIFSEVIVVDDGSQDLTARVAAIHGARVIRQENLGKGAALGQGARAVDADILVFADADLTGFRKEHISALLGPVLHSQAVMSIGLRDRGPFLTWLMEHALPLIGGERAIRRDVFLEILRSGIHDFGIELAMNDYCRKNRLPVKKIRLKGVGQIVKERKYGMVWGFLLRLRMVWQLAKASARLRFSKNRKEQ